MEDFYSGIGKRIKSLRIKQHLTQEEVAQAMHMRRETYNTIENGRRNIKADEICLLAETLNTSCDYIIRGIERENLGIAETTGLSEQIISELKVMHESALTMPNQDIAQQQYLLALNALICTDKGKDVLREIFCYLNSDFTKIYLMEKNDSDGPFKRYDDSIGFKVRGLKYGIYQFVSTENLEFASIAHIIESIKGMKSEKQKNK